MTHFPRSSDFGHMQGGIYAILCVILSVLCGNYAAAQDRPGTASRVLHVDVARGNDANAGTAPDSAWKTIQKACDGVNPGDTVIVHPGIYFENIELKRTGTAERPITFKTDAVGRNRVIVTLARPDIRKGEVKWELVDDALKLYAIPFDYMPSRILYDGVDLFPYTTLDALKKFMLAEDNPAPFHGFVFDPASSKLYVRLYQDRNTRVFAPTGAYGQPRYPAEKGVGKYGPVDPNRHTMCVSPPVSSGQKGTDIGRRDCYNWGIIPEAPAHVILDGFTFETPAVAGVYVRGSDVTVRNCWFLGCKNGVAGGNRNDEDKWNGSDNVTIEYCDYTQYPAYEDVEECIQTYADDPKIAKNRFFWWCRKGMNAGGELPRQNDYENGGPTLAIGKNWVFRNNYVHSIFDGPSSDNYVCEGMRIYNNRFERIIDNALETENHAKDWRIYNNEFVDNFMPISWQPLGGTPWPGPIYLYRNLIYDTPAGAAMWRRVAYPTCWLKVGVREDNWKWYKWMADVPKGVAAVPGDGFVVFNNTIVLNDGYFLERSSGQPIRMENLKFINNIFVLRPLHNEVVIHPDTGADFLFSHNLYSPGRRSVPNAGKVVTGEGGIVVDDVSGIGFRDAPRHQFELLPDSPAVGAGTTDAKIPELSKDLGAVPAGKRWEMPPVGPQPRTAAEIGMKR